MTEYTISNINYLESQIRAFKDFLASPAAEFFVEHCDMLLQTQCSHICSTPPKRDVVDDLLRTHGQKDMVEYFKTFFPDQLASLEESLDKLKGDTTINQQ